MLATACALILDPKLLILDEPTSGLAPQITQELIRGIVDINKEGIAIHLGGGGEPASGPLRMSQGVFPRVRDGR